MEWVLTIWTGWHSYLTDTHSLPEWFAYVPAKMDYSDLYSIMALYVSNSLGFKMSDISLVASAVHLLVEVHMTKWQDE